jgi:hypothetical protein
MMKVVGALVLSILTAALTVLGEFLVEGRKANLDVWKTVQNIQLQLSQDKKHRQIEALYEIQAELKILEGELVLVSQDAAAPLQSRGLVREADEAARTMSRIYPRVAVLDSKLKTAETAKALTDKLSSELATISTEPTRAKANKFLNYYHHEFESAIAAILQSVQDDRNRLESENAGGTP